MKANLRSILIVGLFSKLRLVIPHGNAEITSCALSLALLSKVRSAIHHMLVFFVVVTLSHTFFNTLQLDHGSEPNAVHRKITHSEG